jgi:putative transcriptional regulator
MFTRKPSVKDEHDMPNYPYRPIRAWFYSIARGRLVISISLSRTNVNKMRRPDPILSHRLARLRVEHGMSRQDLAKALDISDQTVIAMELGEYSPSLNLALRISQLFALPIEEIFFLSSLDQAARKTV